MLTLVQERTPPELEDKTEVVAGTAVGNVYKLLVTPELGGWNDIVLPAPLMNLKMWLF